MTYQTYEFTAFTSADLLGGGGTSAGSTFTVPGSASVCFSVSDNDAYLSGDSKCNEQSDDRYGQQASIEGANGQEVGNGGQIYAEVYHWVYDSSGKWYLMIEIEQEGANGDYFTFHNAYGVPPAGESLTFHSKCNIKEGGWNPDYKCLDSGQKVDTNEAPEFDNLPNDGILCIDENETAVLDINASDADGDTLTYEIVGGRDAAFFEIDAHTGELKFKSAPDYEDPQSGGNSNTYDVTVKVSDGNGGSETKAL